MVKERGKEGKREEGRVRGEGIRYRNGYTITTTTTTNDNNTVIRNEHQLNQHQMSHEIHTSTHQHIN